MTFNIMWEKEIELISEILEEQFMNPHHEFVAKLILKELFGKNDSVPPTGRNEK